MKKHSPKSKSTLKMKQDKPFRKLWLLVKGQRISQSQRRSTVKVKVNGQRSASSRLGHRSSWEHMTWHEY